MCYYRLTAARQISGPDPPGSALHASTRGGAAIGGGTNRTAHPTTGREIHTERLQPGRNHQNQHPLPPPEGQSKVLMEAECMQLDFIWDFFRCSENR